MCRSLLKQVHWIIENSIQAIGIGFDSNHRLCLVSARPTIRNLTRIPLQLNFEDNGVCFAGIDRLLALTHLMVFFFDFQTTRPRPCNISENT